MARVDMVVVGPQNAKRSDLINRIHSFPAGFILLDWGPTGPACGNGGAESNPQNLGCLENTQQP